MRRHTVLLSILLLAAGASAQQSGKNCPMTAANNGGTITVRGKVVQASHDMLLSVPGCDDPVMVSYAGEEDTGLPGSQLRRDKNFQRFQTYTSATYKSDGKDICMQCSKYAVEATLTGRLDVAMLPDGAKKDPFGFARDATGKIVGRVGWGHPTPIYQYRLIVESISDVVARKLPRPIPQNMPKKTMGDTLLHESGHAANLDARR